MSSETIVNIIIITHEQPSRRVRVCAFPIDSIIFLAPRQNRYEKQKIKKIGDMYRGKRKKKNQLQ